MKDFGLKKLYYSISEVSKLTGLEHYVLRYWETEFIQLNPTKNRAGNRIYTNKDIQTILKIKKLLREEKYTIEGAKRHLEEIEALQNFSRKKKVEEQEEQIESRDIKKDLDFFKQFLLELKSNL
ncbi:MAG: MerR family transcriptional regulator [Ignavibacteriales bacterium]|nr:MerR family transcriptional regulator [Ignavibacteriales bacterium]